jgi:hypothetical protein
MLIPVVLLEISCIFGIMKYLIRKIFNKTQVAKACNMKPKVFNMKLNHVNYNKFNESELQIINKALAEEILNMEPVLRILLIDFCEELSMPAIELLKMGEFEYVVDSYINKL